MDLLGNVYIDIQGQRDDAVPASSLCCGIRAGRINNGFEKCNQGNSQRPAKAGICSVRQRPLPYAGIFLHP